MPRSTRPVVVLGSRSPRRRELLALLVPEERIVVLPPSSTEEAGFENLSDREAILERLRAIARAKCDDVRAQWGARENAVVVTADTIILAVDGAGSPVVLGQPPKDDAGETIRRWFREHLFGRTHEAITTICVAEVHSGDTAGDDESPDTSTHSLRCVRTVSTRVAFRERDDALLEWYIATGEPFGKAGAYGIQAGGSLFATRIEGSLSNVIGLPLEALREVFGNEFRLDFGE